MEIIYSVIAVIAFTLVLSFFALKKQKSSWSGVLVDKEHTDDEESGKDFYNLIIKTDTGKKLKCNVNDTMYNEAQVGDRYKKEKGDLFPSKVQN